MTTMKRSEKIAQFVEKAKQEIKEDIHNGLVPETVSSFSELHDYVDANCYGGLIDEMDVQSDGAIEMFNEVQHRVNDWILNGMKD